MNVLAIDIGSSSIKAALLRRGKPVGKLARVEYPTLRSGDRAEVNPDDLLAALREAIKGVSSAKSADILALSVMSSGFVALDGRGKPLTPIITHQDRRSVKEAHRLVDKVGEKTLLKVTGNLPFPGGISSTTLCWVMKNVPSFKRKLACYGQLNTFIHSVMTGERVIDPGNASFSGVYETVGLRGWSKKMAAACGISTSVLPEIRDGNEIAGTIAAKASTAFGLPEGLPVTTGVIDTSAAVLLAGAEDGRLLHVCGTTDVLALCSKKPHPHPRYLTRGLGVNDLYVSAATLASAGSTVDWAQSNLFAELSDAAFYELAQKLAICSSSSSVAFAPYLAGERVSIDQRTASLNGLTLKTNREQILQAILQGLAKSSANRFPTLLRGRTVLKDVLVSGGAGKLLTSLFHRDLPRELRYHHVEEATLLGLWKLAEMAKG